MWCFAEYDPTQPPRLNERVLKDKRKKLKETFDRVLNMYVSIQSQLLMVRISIIDGQTLDVDVVYGECFVAIISLS
jgi:hypothetical protein